MKSYKDTIAVVIPCYKVRNHILDVIRRIGSLVDLIIIVDDKCPEETGLFVKSSVSDPRVHVIFHSCNMGVGGAVLSGYQFGLVQGADILIKIDGDGQMDPGLIPKFIYPIIDGTADYTKGNRFYDLSSIKSMPVARLFGNATLSFLSKISSGYWNLFDPTNGYTAIHAKLLKHIPFSKISKRYFFESDMLFRLNLLRAKVVDVPMFAIYGDEISSLKISRVIGPFAIGHVKNFFKRLFYNYYLRDFNFASISLVFGLLFLIFGMGVGLFSWYLSVSTGIVATSGTVMLATLPVFLGFQMILFFLSYDISSVPTKAIHKDLN